MRRFLPSLILRMPYVSTVGIIVVQIFVTATVAIAQQQKGDCSAAQPYMANAEKALSADNLAEAIENLSRAIKSDSNCADAYLLLGLIEFRRGNTVQAIMRYQQTLKLAPRSYSAHYDLALAYLKDNNLDDARRELERAVALDPKQANAAYDLGIVLLQLQHPSEALSYLRRALTLDPNRADVSFNMVRAELEVGDIAEARAVAQEEAGHRRSDFQWNRAVGQLFFKHAQPTDAAVYLRAANLLRPDSDEVRNQLATAYLASRESEKVLDLIEEARSAEDHYLRGSALFQLHRFEEADAESQAAVRLAPEDAKILILRVRLLQRAGDQSAALDMAQRAIGLARSWDQPLYLAGVSYYFTRHYSEARQSLQRAFDLNPSSAATAFLEALAWAGEGNAPEAESWLQRAISLQPKNARFHCHLGILLMREKRDSQAEHYFKQAIELNPRYALPHYELGKLRVRSSKWQDGAGELEMAIALDPGFTSAYYQLVGVYAKLGQKEKSERMLAEFNRLHRQEDEDSAAASADAQQASEAP